MDNKTSHGVPSQEDMELFRRVMRVMNVLQTRTLNNPNQLFSPSAPRRLQSTVTSNLESDRPMMAGAMEDEDEEMSSDNDDEGDDEEDGEDNDDFSDDEDHFSADDSSDSSDFFAYDTELPPLNNLTDVAPYQQPHMPPPAAGSAFPGGPSTGRNNGEDDDDFSDDEDDFSDDENDHSSDSGDIYTYDSELPPPSNFINVAPYHERHTPALAAGPRTGQNDGDGGSLRCWEHECNGRRFTTRSNLRRHLREKSRARPMCRCPQCGAVFSRTTARNTHVARGSCNRIRRYSNGRIRPNLRIRDG